MNDYYSVIYSEEALNDLRNIYSYISNELLGPSIAKEQVNRIRETIRNLNYLPSRNPVVNWEPWYSIGMHKITVDNYVIFYTINTSTLTVSIVRIFYSGRNIEEIIKNTNENKV